MRKTKLRSFLVAAGVSLALAFTLSCSGEEASVIEGIDGNHGKDGVDGVDGNHGIDGKDGADGVDGNHGIDGKDGADGVDGNHGIDGKDGADGVDGNHGVDGKDGADGIDGADGNHGNHGINGEDGKDGEKGDTGAKGDKGDTGADGKDGANGADGIGCDMKDDGAYIVVKCGSDEKKLAKAMCGIKAYDPEAEVCKRGVLWPLCGKESYDPAVNECENGSIKGLPVCGAEEVPFNPKKEETCDDGVVKLLCGANAYLPEEHICESGALKPLCGTLTYDPALEMCNKNIGIVQKSWCGETGYDLYEKICDTRDKQTYKFVTIGTQTWMAENLNYNTNTDGSLCYGEREEEFRTNPNAALLLLSDKEVQVNCDKYGRLYTWEEALTACPAGWHLPTRAEWLTLLKFAGSNEDDCSTNAKCTGATKLKVKSDWFNYDGTSNPDAYGTDDYGFSLMPAGTHGGAQYGQLGIGGYYYTNSPGLGGGGVEMTDYRTNLTVGKDTYFANGRPTALMSVRCLKYSE